MYIAFEYKHEIFIMDLEEFKQQDFYTEENFGKVRIYDFAYLSSLREIREYRKKIFSLPTKKLRKLNL